MTSTERGHDHRGIVDRVTRDAAAVGLTVSQWNKLTGPVRTRMLQLVEQCQRAEDALVAVTAPDAADGATLAVVDPLIDRYGVPERDHAGGKRSVTVRFRLHEPPPPSRTPEQDGPHQDHRVPYVDVRLIDHGLTRPGARELHLTASDDLQLLPRTSNSVELRVTR